MNLASSIGILDFPTFESTYFPIEHIKYPNPNKTSKNYTFYKRKDFEDTQEIHDKMNNITEFIQKSIKKDSEVKKLLLNDKLLNDYSIEVLDLTQSLFKEISSIGSYSFELKKEDLYGDEDYLVIYVYLSEKVRTDEMMEIWKRISKERVELLEKMAHNQNEIDELLEKTTITFRRC